MTYCDSVNHLASSTRYSIAGTDVVTSAIISAGVIVKVVNTAGVSAGVILKVVHTAAVSAGVIVKVVNTAAVSAGVILKVVHTAAGTILVVTGSVVSRVCPRFPPVAPITISLRPQFTFDAQILQISISF